MLQLRTERFHRPGADRRSLLTHMVILHVLPVFLEVMQFLFQGLTGIIATLDQLFQALDDLRGLAGFHLAEQRVNPLTSLLAVLRMKLMRDHP